MTPDDMRMVAAECDALARELAPIQDAGLFAPVTPSWKGLAQGVINYGVPPEVVEFAAVIVKDGKVTGTLKLAGREYVVTANLTDDRKPVANPRLVHRIVNATLSAANTFNHLLAGEGDAPSADPDPKRDFRPGG